MMGPWQGLILFHPCSFYFSVDIVLLGICFWGCLPTVQNPDPSGDASSSGSAGFLSSEEAAEHCSLPGVGNPKNQETIRSRRTGPIFCQLVRCSHLFPTLSNYVFSFGNLSWGS